MSIKAVATTRGTALTVTNGGRVPACEGQDVYLVVMEGEFTLANARRPRRAKAPSGRYLSLTFDTATFRRLDLGLGRQPFPVPLESVGPVTDLAWQE